MVGTWETSGINERGSWKLKWEVRADGTYFLSGLFSDSGVMGSGDERWHAVSDVTKQPADGTYHLRDANHMLGTGPLGSAAWTRVSESETTTSATAAPSAPPLSAWDAFGNISGGKGETVPTPPKLSREESADLMNDWFNSSHNKESRDRLEGKARSGIAEAQTLFGMALESEKNFAEAVSWYRKAAAQGEPNATRNLGTCYLLGKGVTKDAAEAMKWFREAAELGNKEAPADVGDLYQEGTGVAKDEAAAVEWYRKGAARDDPAAMNDLGVCYWDGTGVAKSAREAIIWWKQATEKGDQNAKKNLQLARAKFDESGQPRTRK